jgi:hypothetical protein
MPQLFICIFAFVVSSAQEEGYKPYGNYDLSHALRTKKISDGKAEYSVDKKLTSQVLDDLYAHARDYPTKFRSKGERASRARRESAHGDF